MVELVFENTGGKPSMGKVTSDKGILVSGKSTVVTASPACDTAAYAAGDLIGGKLTLSSVVPITAGSGIIHSVVLADQANQKSKIDVVFFNSDPSGTTFTDQAALDVADADLLKIVGVITIETFYYIAFADNAVATKTSSGLVFKLATGTTLYACLVSRGTPTFAAATDLQLSVKILQD
jgi:hypothetical protein